MKILVVILSFFVVCATSSSASPSYTQAKAAADNVKKAKAQLKRKTKGLNETELAKLRSSYRGTDSDGDGVADELEDAIGSKICNADSDSDGIDDNNDDSPGNSDSNGDGKPDGSDGQPFERKGSVSSFNDPELVIAGNTYVITAETSFVQDKKGSSPFSKTSLVKGLCVEVEGRVSSGKNLVDKIKKDDDC